MTSSRLVAPAERLDVRLCGGLHVSCGDREVPVKQTARQGRLALAYLVLNHDRVVTRDKLMESVATDPDPRRLSASLSQTLSRLRNAIGPDRLERLPNGAVRLRGPVLVDIEHAEEVLKDGRAALAQGQWAYAAGVARAALQELGGEVLAGDEAEWLEFHRTRRGDLCTEAHDVRATASLRMGEWTEAAEAAEQVIAASETRESAVRVLMEAQVAQGDVALATQTYHDFCRRLRETGLSPSAELRELHERLVKGARTSAQVAFPPALSIESGAEAFVGREDTLERLRARFRLAQAGTRQFVVLGGEPGIGKTRLAGEFAREAHAAGATVLYGRSDVETLVPYQPFVAAIGHYVTECGDSALADELGSELSELSRLIPSLARRIPELREPIEVEPEIRRYRLFSAVVSVLAFVARRRPAVLVLDDLQWADRSTVLLLRYAVQEIGNVRLLVLGTVRDVEEPGSDLLAELLARPRHDYEPIGLTGLDAREIAALVMARQGRDALEDGVGALQRRTGGNPLLLEATLAELAPSAEALSGQAVRDAGLPQDAKQVIGRRLGRLSATAQRVLTDASVVGAEFGVPVLETVSAAPADEVIPALEEARDAGLVRELPETGDRFSFAHALVRETLLDGQSASRRRRLHHRIGEALETIGGAHPAELAHHFSESQADDVKALPYSLEAGERAKASFAHEEAAGHFRRALRLLGPGDEPRRCELLLELGSVQTRQGSEEARETFREASELAERNLRPDLLARAALGFASRYTEAGVVDGEAIARLSAARDAVGDGDLALRAELTARLADSLHFAPEPGEAERLSAEALELATEVGDAHALAVALESRHAALLSIDHLDERLRLSRQLIELAELEGERELEALGRHWRIYDLLEAAEMEEARRERDALDALADELRQPLYRHFAVGWDVVWAHMRDVVADVEPLAERFRELGREARARDTETIYHAQLIALRRRREQLQDFVDTVQAAVERHPTLLAWRAVLPLSHLASLDVPAARSEFEWFAHDRFSRVRRDRFWFTTVCVLAETCALLQDRARADVLYELLEPFQDRNVQVGQAACWGSARRFLGLLDAIRGNLDAAADHLEAAIARNEACGNPAAALLVRRDLSTVLRLRRAEGDLERAAELLVEPLRVAKLAGVESLIARIEAEVADVARARGG